MNHQRRYAPLTITDPSDHDAAIAALTMAGIRIEQLRLVLAEVHVATVRAQVLLSMMTDFENFTTFKPHLHHEKHLGTVLDQVVAWGGALKQLR